MNKAGSLLLLLTAIVAGLAGILAFAASKFLAAARSTARAAREGGAETAFMAAAMEEALQKMRTQERAMQARAEASERLSGEIIASLTSGLLVVSQEGIVRTLNPAGRQLLGLPNSECDARLPRGARQVRRRSPTSSRSASSRGGRSSAAR